MSGKTSRDYAGQYTRPELRERLKEEIKKSDKGGRKGQWSARKSQLLAAEYKKEGGGFNGKKKESQKDLERWTATDRKKSVASRKGKQSVANTPAARRSRKAPS